MGNVVAITDRPMRDYFVGFPKIPRMDGNMFITEKIDGTNACVVVTDASLPEEWSKRVMDVGNGYGLNGSIYAQSRNRIITPKEDNYGFAQFVWDNAAVLAQGLGQGSHYGEWWGRGINRAYGLDDRCFSLFNTGRWSKEAIEQGGMGDLPVSVVPLLVVHGSLDTTVVDSALANLLRWGSAAAPGFQSPEGVVVYHSKSGTYFKRTLEGDTHKGVSAQAQAENEGMFALAA